MKDPTTEHTLRQRRWRSRLIAVPAAMLLFALSAQAQPRITAASNPVVVPNGQASATTTITWKAAPDFTYSEIYLSVDNSEWSEFARGVDSSKTATLKLGSSYTFRMLVYEGQAGTPRVITALTVTTVQGNAPSTPGSGGGVDFGDIVSGPIGKNKDAGSVYRDAFAIRNVRVEPGPRHIFIRFNGPPNQVPFVAIGRGAPIRGKDGELVFGDNLVGGGFVASTVSAAEKAKGEYTFASASGTTISNDGLDPGRTYYYIINIPSGNGRKPYQDTGSFVMRQLTTNVKVVWEKVLVLDDSDDLSTGEIDFWFWANYGQPGGKFAQYSNGDADSGHTYPINRTVVLNNAPNTLTLAASGRDNDATFSVELTEDEPPLKGPRNGENDDENVATDSFDLTKYDDNATVNFVLNAMPGGSLNFVIFGRFEITRVTAERTGTTSGALTPAPATPPGSGKVLGRVKLPPTNAPPRPICEVAREARARNSPAAPGLEAQCRANLAALGAKIAEQDPIVAEARNAEADELYRQGFDIATGIFGDPAQGAQGNTATGPGSLGIRDALSAAGQRGFNDSVKLHLSRNYRR